MKTPEDEAFDELAQRQGAWGGGFQAKRQAAMDKINSEFREEYVKYRTAFPKGYTTQQVLPKDYTTQQPVPLVEIEYTLSIAEPAQEPVAREWNFCPRCGKRTKDLTVIHTCTPPQGDT